MCADQGDGNIMLIAEEQSSTKRLQFFNLCEEALAQDEICLVKMGLRDTLMDSSKVRSPCNNIILVFHSKSSGGCFMAAVAQRGDATVSFYADNQLIDDWEI
jgi:hypothetical protein